MARLVLLIFSISTTIAQSLSNASSSGSSELEASSQDKLESQIYQVSPVDIENNTGPFMRSDSGLNRLLALSNPPNLPIEGGLNTDALSIDNLANQIGVTVTEQNLLGNFNNLNTENAQANDPQLLQQTLDFNSLNSQSVNDYLNSNALFTKSQNVYQLNSNPYQANTYPLNLPQDSPYTLTKVYESQPVLLTDTNENQLLNSVQSLLNQPSLVQSQGLNNFYQQQGSVLTDTSNDQFLNSVQSLLTQQVPGDYSLNNVYQTPGQYQSLLTEDQALNVGQFGLEQTADLEAPTAKGSLYQLDNTNQILNLESILGQNLGSNANQLLNVESVLGQNAGLNTNQLFNVESLLGQEGDMSNLQSLLLPEQGNVRNTLGLLPQLNNNLETRIVFKNQLPNLNVPNCKAALGTLLQSAFAQYLKLAKLPYCQLSGTNTYPTSNLPFEIIVVPAGTTGQTTNPVLLKLLWQLLNRLKNPPIGNQSDSIIPILIELILKPVQAPNAIPNIPDNNLFPGQNHTPNLSTLLLLLKLLENRKQNPSHAYLYEIIVDIIKQKYPNHPGYWPPNPYDELSHFNANPAAYPVEEPADQVPIVYPPVFPTGHPPVFPTDYPPVFPTDYPPAFPTGYPSGVPTQYPPSPPTVPIVIPTPTYNPDSLPHNINTPEHPELANPTARYVILMLQKFLPQQKFTVQDILFIIELVNTLPKTYNELVLNPQLLQQVTIQLTNRNMNPQLVLALIYKYLIQFSNQSLVPGINTGSNRVVVLKYQVKRQTPFVYQPYYYVLYKLPYSHFVKNLQQLLIAKPHLKQNRSLLFKELLILAMSNNYAVTSDFNGISKEYLVQLIANQGATPLDVKVVNDNIANEQLKVMNDLNSQVGSDSTIVAQTGTLDSDMLGGVQGVSGSNLWAYLIQQPVQGQLTNFNVSEVTTINPLLQYIRSTENARKNILQNSDKFADPQDVEMDGSKKQ